MRKRSGPNGTSPSGAGITEAEAKSYSVPEERSTIASAVAETARAVAGGGGGGGYDSAVGGGV